MKTPVDHPVRFSLYKHLLYTWLLAQLLHPLLFGFYCSLIEQDQLFFGWDHVKPILSFMCVGIVVSFPALLLSILALRVILFTARRPAIAFTLWMCCILAAIIIGSSFMMLFFMGYFNIIFLNIFIPGMAAGIGAVLIRRKQFIQLFCMIHYRRLRVRANNQPYHIAE
jgi:hypothetical protein